MISFIPHAIAIRRLRSGGIGTEGIPADALLDETGAALLDEAGDYITEG